MLSTQLSFASWCLQCQDSTITFVNTSNLEISHVSYWTLIRYYIDPSILIRSDKILGVCVLVILWVAASQKWRVGERRSFSLGKKTLGAFTRAEREDWGWGRNDRQKRTVSSFFDKEMGLASFKFRAKELKSSESRKIKSWGLKKDSKKGMHTCEFASRLPVTIWEYRI